jgi:hypothetical protein
LNVASDGSPLGFLADLQACEEGIIQDVHRGNCEHPRIVV